MGAEGYLVSPAVFKTVEGGDPALVSSILTCPRQKRPRCFQRGRFVLYAQPLAKRVVGAILERFTGSCAWLKHG